ncbi:TonB-dependent receptor plug domain-containing protein [Mucilaginibacter litoreus]|uniref:TonB-dependent receptor plug domain-containing protein n=1 Tax=Mucilaginibacter litoreus TaxID=1048221 RepID=A0ABW3ARC2_9SPHI
MKKALFILCAVSLHCSAWIHAQIVPAKTNTKEIFDKLKAFAGNNAENVYLHFDKPYYSAGDTIYFKAYVTQGEKHQLSKISGVLHVDLINRKDSILKSLILKLNNGLAWGDFALPAYLLQGSCRVRAYTKWMLNYGSIGFFDKVIAINQKKPGKAVSTDQGFNVQFFPEGGMLVNDIPCRVAFKATGANGLGADVKGVVTDNTGKVISNIISSQFGLGSCYITPLAGKSYKAVFNLANRNVGTFNLPEASESGITLTVNNADSNKVAVDLNASKPYYLANKNKQLTVFIYSQGLLKTVKTLLDNQMIGFDIPKKDLNTGIALIALFNDDGKLMGQRMVFINKNDQLQLKVNSDKNIYAPYQAAKIALNAKTPDGKAAVASFSVSVVNETLVPADYDTGDNILSYYLLTSKLKDYVEQPGYYFKSNNPNSTSDLDVLMLTQIYSYFNWENVLNDTVKTDTTLKPEKALQIKGRLLSKDGKPLPNEKLSVLIDDSQSVLAVTDPDGRFTFSDINFTNNSKILLIIENKSIRKKAQVTLEENHTNIPVTSTALHGQYTYSDGVALIDSSKQANVYTANAKVNPFNKRGGGKGSYHTVSLAGAGNADQVIFSKDIRNAPSLSQGLISIVRGVDFEEGRAYVRGLSTVFASGQSVREPMMLVIDGAIIPNGNMDNLSPKDVESVEILKGANASIYGMGSGAGVLVINTKRGDSNDSEQVVTNMSPGIMAITPQGFYQPSRFNTDTDIALKKRAMVLWKPDILTDTAGNAVFEYYNAAPGSYRVTIEGIDSNGNIGRAVYSYKVQ